ncbi:acyl-CoA dehydratase activase [Alkalispirochaeta alkalica]|uniref:acyl-CoA dehydratase activase n=1 Tax=Alkalispirochaeta alkalica TaxID=46356 RepID=UPI00248193BC|nr:acyl-CoA dehydratase activase [Alkalispirochaeta alkalica]
MKDEGMYSLGIDIGSTTSKGALLADGNRIVATALRNAGIGTDGPEEVVKELLRASDLDEGQIGVTVSTGYGRTLYPEAHYRVSELTCHALGAHFIFPGIRTLIDIGGQDAKVISLDGAGRMSNFQMNDKCAAGTGRFLDVMAGILQLRAGDLAGEAALAESICPISSTCTVFAESEVISHLAQGVNRKDLVAGICESVATRTGSLAKRVGVTPPLAMSGGVALNEGVRGALSRYLGVEILFSPLAQFFGGLGAALYGYQTYNKEN